MGKAIEKIKLANIFEPLNTLEIDALVDTGTTMLALPQNIIDELGLKKVREVMEKL